MMNFFIKLFASRALKGKKTYLGAAGKALAGLGTMITGVLSILSILSPDSGIPAATDSIEAAWAMIAAGWYGISSGLSSAGARKALDK